MIQLFQEIHHFITIRRIQISRRFIGKDNAGVGNNGTRYSHTLLLSTGKLLRIMLGAVTAGICKFISSKAGFIDFLPPCSCNRVCPFSGQL